ncbi:beta-propeller domain-containing protein [Halorarius halobius]|uniref:beta-propeller domain-containing protein n=1 Tax=Halorarius halobius TaxID=2962671 RepID=UPI0020CD6FD9|nr:beta-propeller domain-containing protein [Halorarius halobius]
MRHLVPAVVAVLVVAGVGGAVLIAPDDGGDPEPNVNRTATNDSLALVTSETTAAFQEYRQRGQRQSHRRVRFGGARFQGGTATEVDVALTAGGDGGAAASSAAPVPESSGGDAPRYGETNVQVDGVDEPDVLKTVDGRFYYAMPDHRVRAGDEKPVDPTGRTVAVDATDPDAASVSAHIDRSGRMLVDGDRLVVLGEDQLAGYDISNPDAPELVWTRNVTGRITTARLHDGQVYLVAGDRLDDDCEVEPLEGTTVPCTAVHHPREPVPVDVAYTAVQVDADDGAVRDRFAFVGGPDATVYMSTDGLYVTYLDRASPVETRMAFLLSEGTTVLDDQAVERLREVRSYDLSPSAERAEIEATLRRWRARLPDDEREERAEELADSYRTYLRDNRRSLDRTHVVRLSLDGGLSAAATGTVPGRVLDQFSFSAHDGHLRVATTVGERPGVESANDVYVLDTDDLSVEGSVTGMSEGQRVYGVRFVGDTGYVITYRQVDPLHVIDLSDPADPEQTGKLKLPGFSRYLHPLDDGRLLGVGEEDGHVKAVVFDVSDPTDPRVAHSRVFDARYSAVERTHHAFTRDPRHDVVFLPTRQGGYVLSERNLTTVKRVGVVEPRRARYAGDHLYVFGATTAAVIDERTWNRTDTVELRAD